MSEKRAIATIDCETDPFQYKRLPKPFLWGYYDGEEYLEFTKTNDLCDFISQANRIIYAHNGGKFDFHFLIDKLRTFKPMLVINGRIVKTEIGNSELRDSYSIVPVPLSAYNKEKIDYWKFEKDVRKKYMNEIKHYLYLDCKYLYELVYAFVNKFGAKITTAQAALSECKRIMGISNQEITSTKSLYDELKPFYFGGRVAALKRGRFQINTYTYDINSAYPYAMTMNHPIGRIYKVLTPRTRNKINPTAFYFAKINSDGSLPLRTNGSLTYPKGKHDFFVGGRELLSCIASNCILEKIHYTIEFKDTINFTKYVNTYYEMKNKAERGSTDYIFSKLMLNSLYGKFATNPNNYFDYILIEPQFISAALHVDGYEFHSMIGNLALMYRPIDEKQHKYYNIATAASITSTVRSILISTMQYIELQGGTVFYCDTDSIITDIQLPSNIVGEQLGQWKLESENKDLIIIAPKLYGSLNSITGHWKIASKGVELTSYDLEQLAKGKQYIYFRKAPTYSINKQPEFISRKIPGLAP